MYAINAVVVKGGISSQVPTFYLDENVQGIKDENHAINIARDVLDPFKEYVINANAESLIDKRFAHKAFIFALKIK